MFRISIDNKIEAASVTGISIRTDGGIIKRRNWCEWFRESCIWRFFEKNTCCTICLGKICVILISEQRTRAEQSHDQASRSSGPKTTSYTIVISRQKLKKVIGIFSGDVSYHSLRESLQVYSIKIYDS